MAKLNGRGVVLVDMNQHGIASRIVQICQLPRSIPMLRLKVESIGLSSVKFTPEAVLRTIDTIGNSAVEHLATCIWWFPES